MGFETVAIANRFLVVLDGVSFGMWASASGLDVSWGLCEYRAGDMGNARWFFPGATKYSDVQLSRAACAESGVVKKWLDANSKSKGSLEKKSGTITLMTSDGAEVTHWTLANVMPLKWAIEKFDASASKVAMETLTLAHEGFLDDLAKG